jgi:glycosyltransferase involved in cell wall biosynthesis
MNNITLIIPAKNEEESLPIVLDEIKNFKLKKIIIVNKLSKKILYIAKKYDCKIIKQSKSGYGNAIIEGLGLCKTKYACIFNADGSFNPNDLFLMSKKLKLGFNFVFASRYLNNGGSDDDTIITWVGNKIFSLIGRIFFKIQISDILYTFIVGHTIKFKELNLEYNDFRLCVEIPIKIKRNKFKYTSISSFERPRIAGKKNVNEFKDGFLILCALLKFYFKNVREN